MAAKMFHVFGLIALASGIIGLGEQLGCGPIVKSAFAQISPSQVWTVDYEFSKCAGTMTACPQCAGTIAVSGGGYTVLNPVNGCAKTGNTGDDCAWGWTTCTWTNAACGKVTIPGVGPFIPGGLPPSLVCKEGVSYCSRTGC